MSSCLPPWCAYSHIWVALRCFPWRGAYLSIAPGDRSHQLRLIAPQWAEIERPFPAFALCDPGSRRRAVAATRSCAIAEGGGRKDILSLGEPDGAAPYLQVEIYRPGSEIPDFAGPQAEIAAAAAGLGPVRSARQADTLASKFGPLTIVAFETTKGTPRHCLGFVRAYDDPRLQLSGWFCQGGADFIERSTLACALDRLTLLSAGSEPKVGALFAHAELHRSYLRPARSESWRLRRSTQLLWKAAANRPEPRRVGR